MGDAAVIRTLPDALLCAGTALTAAFWLGCVVGAWWTQRKARRHG